MVYKQLKADKGQNSAVACPAFVMTNRKFSVEAGSLFAKDSQISLELRLQFHAGYKIVSHL